MSSTCIGLGSVLVSNKHLEFDWMFSKGGIQKPSGYLLGSLQNSSLLGQRVGSYSFFVRVWVPLQPPLNQKCTIVIPRLLLGLVALNPKP